MLRLETFGGLSLRIEGGSGVLMQRRRLALLALLSGAGERGLSREKIAAYLWPDGSLESTRRSLDQLVYGVRHAVGETVLLGTTPLRLNAAIIASDVALFEQALADKTFAAAAELYRGPFLDGFGLPKAPEFERWMEMERARLAELAASAFERLATEAAARDDRGSAVDWWRRLAAHDPLRVPAALGLMRALVAASDRGGALSHARMYEQLVRQELDSAPDPAITRLAEELRQDGETTHRRAQPPQGSTTSPVRDDPAPASHGTALPGEIPSRPPSPIRSVAGIRGVALGAAILVGAVVAAWAVWRGRDVTTGARFDRHTILVTPFRVVGTDSSLREFSEGVVDLLSAEFTGEGGPTAIDARTALSAWERWAPARREPNAADAREVARRAQADWALVGELIQLPDDRVRVVGRLLGARNKRVRVVPPVSGSRDSLSRLLDEFGARVLALDAGIADAHLRSVTTRSLPALRAYLAGRVERRRGHDDAAVDHFARAIELDSTFALAALDLVSTTGWLLRWRIVTPFDSGTRLVALLPGSNAARTTAEEARFDRALRIAWRERTMLSARDRDLLTALRGDAYPQPAYAREVLANLERATGSAPDRAETHYAIGHLLLYQGPALGLTDSRERANASLQHAVGLDSSYAAPLAALVELAALEEDTVALRRFGMRYLAHDSVGAVADYIRWRVAAGTHDAPALRALRSRFASLSTQTLERIQTTSQVAGIALEDADRAMEEIVRRSSGSYERWIALFNANILALNRGRPREALRLLRLKRQLERNDDALRSNACLDATFGHGRPLTGADAVRGVSVATSTQSASLPFAVILCRVLAHDDTSGVAATVNRLRRTGDERAQILEAVRANMTMRSDAGSYRQRLDSLALRGCCSGPKWIGLVAARLHERAGDDVSALRALRAGRWLFPPQYLSTYLREEGRLAARMGDRTAAIRAYRHYLALRSHPEPELRTEVDRVKEELRQLEP